ncbi:CBL-interacting serine/threonine-protein kinase 7 [Sarcoptes scabiei]|uniref:non-specific serine/threonine protein kinase n=1 Tax=Sarcoptes scabiei TaxID=52283 RepID=A0A834RG13_SARSC|nr:CBL-interacting serine/threonine-protein kinase 7 [Sarcoptes scabiei]
MENDTINQTIELQQTQEECKIIESKSSNLRTRECPSKLFYTNSLWIRREMRLFDSITESIRSKEKANQRKFFNELKSSSFLAKNCFSRNQSFDCYHTNNDLNRFDCQSAWIHKSVISFRFAQRKHQRISNGLENDLQNQIESNQVVTPFKILVHGYLLHRIIAKGTFSTLYEAYRLFITQGRLACKRIHLGDRQEYSLRYRIDSDEARWKSLMQKSFLQEEIKILQSIKHPNIVPLYEIIHCNKDYYLMMKFAINKTIHYYLYVFWQKPLPETYVKRWTRQLMSAVQYIHSEHIAHRDLKLDNFLLDEKYNALLSDFGLALNINDHRFAHNLLSVRCGTPEYMAPEVSLVYSLNYSIYHYDPISADIFSMGVCIFEMLNYYLPFPLSITDRYENGYDNLIWRQKHRQYKFNNQIYLTGYCKDLLHRMLEPRPKFRLTASQVLEHSWFRYSIR